MKYKIGYIAFAISSLMVSVAEAQVKFNFNGLGRSIVTSNKLSYTPIDTAAGATPTDSINKAVSGYMLFDLQPNIEINNKVKVTSILRLRNPFGSFFGQNSYLNFRQFQIAGVIGRRFNYEIGDVYLGEMTKFTVYNPEEIWHCYESDVFKMRRDILEYENFIVGNKRRMQGFQGNTYLKFNSGIETIAIKLFATRSNSSNELNIPDRFFTGGRLNIKQSKLFSLGLNYVGLQDVPVDNLDMNYSNNMASADLRFNLDKDKFAINLVGEVGGSKFKNTLVNYNVVRDSSAEWQDLFYDVDFAATIKPAKLKVLAGYRNVGYDFTNPGAQTIRNNVNRTPALFPQYYGDINVNRNQTNFDRLTDEGSYNRSLSLFYNYNSNDTVNIFRPEYGNVTPFGAATANRNGMSFGLATDTSQKYFRASAKMEMYKEVRSETGFSGDLRSFSAIKAGAEIFVGKLLSLDRNISVGGGMRMETTERGGNAPVDLSSTLIDGGLTIEALKDFDVLFGYKSNAASGNEYTSVRNIFGNLNLPKNMNIDVNESIMSLGARFRFSEKSFVTANYNMVKYVNNINKTYNYDLNQVFFNYTLQF